MDVANCRCAPKQCPNSGSDGTRHHSTWTCKQKSVTASARHGELCKQDRLICPNPWQPQLVRPSGTCRALHARGFDPRAQAHWLGEPRWWYGALGTPPMLEDQSSSCCTIDGTIDAASVCVCGSRHNRRRLFACQNRLE